MSEINKLILQENAEFSDYKVDQSIICNKTTLRAYIGPKTDEEIDEFENISIPYIFYPHTEGATIEKLSRNLKTQLRGSQLWIPESKSNLAFVFDHGEKKKHDPYNDNEAEESYLKKRPLSFFIISKSNTDQIELAKMISEHWNCVLITPETVLREEISSGSRSGKCINYNLQNGRAIGPEVILRLAEKRIKSQTAKHRGFVIAGFPLIPNKLYKPDPLSSESAVFNVEEIFEKFLDPLPDDVSTMKGSRVSLEDEEIEIQDDIKKDTPIKSARKKNRPTSSENRQTDVGPERVCIKSTESFNYLTSLENQLLYIRRFLKDPTILIYININNVDVLNKVEQCRFNILMEQELILQGTTGTYFDPSIEIFFEEDEYNLDLKNFVKLPTYFSTSVSAQLLEYKMNVQHVVDKLVIQHDPQFFIKIDGRLSALKMYSAIRPRLKSLGLQPVLIPQELSKLEEIEGEGEEIEESGLDKTPEEMFKKIKNINVVSPMYKWQLSNWGYNCPVALKEGTILKGNTKNAVQFMNKIYFLSDEEAVLSFCRNPRPYLLPIIPNPLQRIFIIGPKFSGRTAISNGLSYAYNCEILNPDKLEENYKKKKRQEYFDKIKNAAINEGLLILTDIREKERETKISFWIKNITLLLKTKYPEFKSKTTSRRDDESSGDRKSDDYDISDISSEKSIVSNLSARTYDEIISELDEYKLPKDKNKIKLLLEDQKKLLEYLPDMLKAPIIQPTALEPFVNEYVQDVIENTSFEDADLTPEEMVDMFQYAIKKVDYDCTGWVIDGFPPNIDLLEQIDKENYPNHIICLNDPEEKFLLDRFERKQHTDFKDYKDFFIKLKRHSAAERVSIQTYSDINDLSQLLSVISRMKENVAMIKYDENFYANHLHEFNQNWEQIKDLFDEIPLEINIVNKKIPDILTECMNFLEDKHRRTANILSEEDKAEEIKDFGGQTDELDEEEAIGEETTSSNELLENRRFGDTNNYCPVAFHDYFVLWKGKEIFSASFESKIYWLSSEEALDKFVKSPRSYLEFEPPQKFPPTRICIVGTLGTGKTTLAKKIAREFGLFYIDFEELLLDEFDLDTNEKIHDLLRKEPSEDYLEEIDTIKKYIFGEDPLPEYVLDNVIKPIWFFSPYQTKGFVLDNFPKKDLDIKYMTDNFLIPDLIIELQTNLEEIHTRLFEIKLNHWRIELEGKKRLKGIENQLALRNWEQECKKRIDFLVNEIKEERKQEFLLSQPPVPPYSSPVDSYTALPEEEEEEIEQNVFIYDSVQETMDLDEIKERVEEEIPKPIFEETWESLEEATERIEATINEIYERDSYLLSNLKNQANFENIDYTNFNSNKSVERVFLEVAKFIDKFKFKNKSFFERVYTITIDVAEKLLEQGYFFLSKFGRTCPVQVYEKTNPIQLYLCSESKMSVFPMIHRRYIYFLCGPNHRDKFKENPLVYLENEHYKLPLLTYRIAIIGPPKCGKTFLAEKFQKEFGFKVVTRGQASRYVLKNLSSYELAENMNKVLDKGWSLTSEMTTSAVEALTLQGKSVSQGFVMDGFPNTLEEFKHLVDIGMVPHVIIDISTDEETIEKYVTSEIKKLPTYSFEFIKHRYTRIENKTLGNVKILNIFGL